MTYLLDTNIIIHLVRNDLTWLRIDKRYSLFSPSSRPAISVVTIGELYSFALQRNWGVKKQADLAKLFKNLLIIDINSSKILQRYAEIDAYSQNRLTDKPMPTSARNMGKNDVWIAATASVLQIPLLTTDADFQHLDTVYLELHQC
jgi:tRNA(fMet)-specific endonuclease VapC